MWQRKTKPKEWKTVWITYCLNGSQCVRNMIAKDPTKHEKCTEKQQMQRRTKYSHIFSQTIFTFSPFNFNAFYSVDFCSDQMWQCQENQMQHNGQFITREKKDSRFSLRLHCMFVLTMVWKICDLIAEMFHTFVFYCYLQWTQNMCCVRVSKRSKFEWK